jgi:hypothetical protein
MFLEFPGPLGTFKYPKCTMKGIPRKIDVGHLIAIDPAGYQQKH